jgi:hypothetical protein
MSQSGQNPAERDGGRRFHRPARLFSEPVAAQPGPEHFFELETIADPGELLSRATELAVAFRTAADRAVEYQATAAAQLADPSRFDRLTAAAIAERAGWTEDYAHKMIEFGRELERRPSGE